MKRSKSFSLLCCLALLLAALSGCAPAALPAPETAGRRAAPAADPALPTDGYPLTVGGVVLRPPLTVADLEAQGFAIAAPDAPTLAPLTLSDPLTVTGQGVRFEGRLYNQTEEPCAWRDCLLASIRADQGVTADGGVTIGSLSKEVSAVYGGVDEGSKEGETTWMMYGTWLYYGLGFQIDAHSQQVLSMVSFCVPLGAAEAKQP